MERVCFVACHDRTDITSAGGLATPRGTVGTLDVFARLKKFDVRVRRWGRPASEYSLFAEFFAHENDAARSRVQMEKQTTCVRRVAIM